MATPSGMKTGDTVVCCHADNYSLTEGKQYVITEFMPYRCPDVSTDWSFNREYTVCTGDNGKPLMCHATRFKQVQSC